MSIELDFLIERKYHKKVKTLLWKLEPHFSKFLFFFSIFQFFLENFILRINYAVYFSGVGDWEDLIFAIILLGTIMGGFVGLPIYFYFKGIYNKLGGKSSIAYELYLSIFFLVMNFVLNNLRGAEMYIYIFFFSTFAISFIGILFLYSPTEGTISLISQAINPRTAFNVYSDLINNRLNNILNESYKREENIQEYLRDFEQNPDNSNKVYEFLEEKKGLLEDYLLLREYKNQITIKFNESEVSNLSTGEVPITESDCKEEFKLRSLINKKSGKVGFCYIGGFFILMFGIMGVILPFLNLPINLPFWLALIMILLSIFLWVYGYKLKKKTTTIEKKLEILLEKYKIKREVT